MAVEGGTATVPDVDTIAHLDFDPANLCGVNECKHLPDPQPAVALVVWTMPCCEPSRDPVCAEHRDVIESVRQTHGRAVCDQHGGTTCAHLACHFEPLP